MPHQREAECEANECPYRDKVNTLYEKVVSGNGELPIAERVRTLEGHMESALPILRDLKTAADRQDGRDAQRLEDEKKRDKEWARFRQTVITIMTVAAVVISAIALMHQIHAGLDTIPKIFQSGSLGPAYARSQEPSVEAILPSTFTPVK